MDGPTECDTEDREEKYHRTLLTYVASKMIQIFLLTKQKQIHRQEIELMVAGEKDRENKIVSESGMDMYTLLY